MRLRIAHVAADTDAEGPGRRFAVWVQGCPIRCPGCCNPEMFPASGGTLVDVDELAARIDGVEGLTLLGGEPFEQAGAAAALARRVRDRGLSVVVFSGYVREELVARGDPDVDALLAVADVLVDGRYDREQPERGRRWIGSANQRVHFLTDRYGPRDFEGGNTVEIRLDARGIAVNGWPGQGLLGGRR